MVPSQDSEEKSKVVQVRSSKFMDFTGLRGLNVQIGAKRGLETGQVSTIKKLSRSNKGGVLKRKR